MMSVLLIYANMIFFHQQGVDAITDFIKTDNFLEVLEYAETI